MNGRGGLPRPTKEISLFDPSPRNLSEVNSTEMYSSESVPVSISSENSAPVSLPLCRQSLFEG